MLVDSPIEIRRAIYAHLIDTPGVHIARTENGEFSLCGCIGPDLYAEHTGFERRPTNSSHSEPVWARRLASSWGPHWECEEIALRVKEELGDEQAQTRVVGINYGAILRVCKRIYFEFMKLVMELVPFHVTDLQTLDAILDVATAPPASPSPSIPFGFKTAFLPRVTKLDITLRLPQAFFEALEESNVSIQELNSPVLDDDLKIWPGLSRRISKLKALRSLRIWLDHVNKPYWSVVNERAVLSQFEPLASNSDLDMCFELPKLHPELENPHRHYIADATTIDSTFTTVSPLKIRRILRQRYQAKKEGTSYYRTLYAQDFPHCVGHPIAKNWSVATMELWEGDMWRTGEDVRYLLSLLVME